MVQVSGLGTCTQEGDGWGYQHRNFRVRWVSEAHRSCWSWIQTEKGRPGSDRGWNQQGEGLEVEEEAQARNGREGDRGSRTGC